MRESRYSLFLGAFIVVVLGLTPVSAQNAGKISGSVTDASGAFLPGAEVEIQQRGPSTVSDNQGQFTIANLAPGSYTVMVSYVGFSPFQSSVTVAAGQTAHLDAVLKVASESESVIVTAERAHGEAEAINEIRTADNILNVLPAEVITSLPNANIADAVGRLPGVTLERDEGEGKYVQIRGTEPRLSNLTIDGVEVPSPEGGIRQVKLDVVPAELIDAVQISKTLQANQDGDAIGGSVNLVTKVASDRPTLSVFGSGGFTPIFNTVPVAEGGLTAGQRFGAQKRLGVLFSGSYDYNGRGINDIEPLPTILSGTTFTPDYLGIAIRDYKYNRNRYGAGGSVDYKLGESSLVYVRGLFSDFKDSGRRWEYTLVNNDPALGSPGSPGFDTEIRAAHYQVGSVLVGGNHVFAKYYSNWGLSASRARVFNPINGGESIDTFAYTGPTSQCQYDPAATKTVYRPQWTPVCYAEAYNPNNFQLTTVEDAAHGQASQLNLQAQVSGGRIYQAGSHSGRFEMGFRIRNAHKFDDSFENFWAPNPALNLNLPISAFPAGLTDKNYYDGSYPLGPLGSWDKINRYIRSNPGNFIPDPNNTSNTYGTNPANFDLVERVTAGYIMNTIDFSRFTFAVGLRIEGTQFYSAAVNTTTVNPCVGLCVKAGGDYIDALPSASLRYRLDNNSGIRFVYSRALSRPLPQQLTTAISEDTSTAPSTFNVGAVLRPEHSNNYDALYERYLTPLGIIQAGFFYKSISSPIVTNVILASSGPFTGHFVATPANAGTAYVTGFEVAFQQHFTYLPRLLSGLGVSANYSYTTSGTTGVDPLRTDNPALLRQAPNTWNISPTYDRRRLSVRIGLAYNGPNIFQYQYHDLAPNPTPPPATIPNPQPGGIKGPNGDNYLYAHFQVDAQGSYYLGKGVTAIVSGLNLNNEVFGFYNGSPQFVVQREYYKPTYSFGFRWDLQHEK
ncbi:MAG TPA: TonB-dependent receptor [Terriglobales bacterium]|nr:TonB-dependent receptor [Terriglobales bacterium]